MKINDSGTNHIILFWRMLGVNMLYLQLFLIINPETTISFYNYRALIIAYAPVWILVEYLAYKKIRIKTPLFFIFLTKGLFYISLFLLCSIFCCMIFLWSTDSWVCDGGRIPPGNMEFWGLFTLFIMTHFLATVLHFLKTNDSD